MTFNKDGIYHIEHAHVPVRIALASHSSTDGTHVVAWSVTNDYLDHLWLIKSVPGEADTYTIRNTVGGTFMDSGGQPANGAQIVGYHETNSDNQKGIIKKETTGTGYWKIMNKSTQNFVDLLNGGSANGTNIVGWKGGWSDGSPEGHQLWTFNSQSLLGSEIHTLLQNNPYIRQDFKSYISDGRYLILSRAHLQDIWRNSGLSSRKWREEIFDCDDFSFVYKAEVAKWGDSQFKADGFAIICGVMFGVNAQNEAHAYNWMVNPEDQSSIVFFEPQNNTFMINPGYNAYFGVF
ncbi:Moa, A lectin from the mushroom marasmius Oreades in complex with the trisaccharide Galgalglcnac [Cubamyces lactineus]|nr:Moa, A lectin from the mushroom marasmius Oreades in complex with the trisaccharide Galgalglcnac [Cubamyces lactineus]